MPSSYKFPAIQSYPSPSSYSVSKKGMMGQGKVVNILSAMVSRPTNLSSYNANGQSS